MSSVSSFQTGLWKPIGSDGTKLGDGTLPEDSDAEESCNEQLYDVAVDDFLVAEKSGDGAYET
jgi:hypothetical protein